MLEKNKKNRDLGAENGSYSSRFVVDLKSLSAQKEEKIEKALIEKIADFNFDKFFAFFRALFLRIGALLKSPVIKFQKFYLNYKESQKLKKAQKAQIALEKKLKKASRLAVEQSQSVTPTADFSAKTSDYQTEPLTSEISVSEGSVSEIAPKKSQTGLIHQIIRPLVLVFASVFQFGHFVIVNLFLLFWNPAKKALPKPKAESSYQANTPFLKNKIFQAFFIAIKSFVLELAFVFNKIGNFGPNLCLSLKNKSQNRRFKQEIRARLAKQSDEEEAEFEYIDPPVLAKRKFALVSPTAVLKLALILLLIVSPFKLYDYYNSLDLNSLKGRVLGVTEHALADLGTASKSAIDLNFNEAGDYFSQAGAGFLEAQAELEGINKTLFTLASLAPSEEMKMAAYSRQILEAGEAGAGLGENFSRAFASFFDAENKADKSLTDMIDDFNHYAFKASENAEDLAKSLQKIDYKVLPEEYRDQFLTLQEKSQELQRGIIAFLSITESLKEFLGATEDKRYLLVFQNNTEMRASGGFIGSFALVDFRRGEIRNLEAPGGGSYDTEAGLTEFVSAPDPLHLISPLWNFWDANWWPDWPTSANKLMWFYEKSDGPTVDGVISFTPTVLERFLEIFGEIDMSEEYGVVLNKDNFLPEVQRIVEERPAWHDEKGEALNEEGERLNPKRIIGDMMQKIIQELPEKLTQENFVSLISLVEKSLGEKHILFYFTDEELQAEIENRGWGGKMRETNRDYLSVINTNIAGGKSDRRIQEAINHSAEIMPNGAVIATLKITREHSGERGEPFFGVRNVNWMRIYVPEGSELLEAQGFREPDEIYFKESDSSWQTDLDVYRTEGMAKIHEASGTKIYRENGKTVFANWSMVDPGEKTTVYLKYKLPFILKKEPDNSFWGKLNRALNPEQAPLHAYTLLIQKQPGSVNSRINSSLKASANFSPSWKYPTDLNLVSDGWKMSSGLDTDKYWALVFKKND